MKLYYTAGSCSMSCHIALEEAGVKHTAIQLDFDKPNSPEMTEMHRLNPLDVVPVLVTNDNKTLTQNAAILEFIADANPQTHLLPTAGTYDRAYAMSWLSFVAADLHKAFGPLFVTKMLTTNETAQGEIRKFAETNLQSYFGYMDKHLATNQFLAGSQFTVADCYAFVVMGWTKFTGVSYDTHKNLTAYVNRIYQRPAVQRVLKAEGLLN